VYENGLAFYSKKVSFNKLDIRKPNFPALLMIRLLQFLDIYYSIKKQPPEKTDLVHYVCAAFAVVSIRKF
jgi:hypothetical protein